MTPQENPDPVDARIPASRIERLFPNLAYSVVALGGGLAGLLLLRALDDITHTETQGIARVAEDLTNANTSISAGLVLGAIFAFLAIAVLVGMLFGTRNTASPSVVYTLVPGLTGLASAALATPPIKLLILAPLLRMDFAEVKPRVLQFAIGAIVLSALTILLSLIFSFIPAKSRAGRKYAPLVLTLVMGLAMIFLIVIVSYQMYSITHTPML